MKSPLAQSTAKSAKTLAQQIAKQMAQEPLEVLRDVKEQTTGVESPGSQEGPRVTENSDEQKKALNNQQELQDKMKSTRRMEALNRELDDIHKQDVFKDLQAKISEGIIIPLEDYPELSLEQKQVLKAQMEAVNFQKQQAEYNRSQEGFKTPVSKKGRRFGQTQKQEAERQQTRVEKPVPPSG